MTAGDPSEWDDFFADRLVPAVLTLVYEAWNRIAKPSADEHEDHTSIRLYAAMLSGKDRNVHPFLIRYQDVEIDTDIAKETGRKDIVFFPPANDEDIYFCLESKRLNARVKGVMKSLADEYVKEGMQRFVDARYSRCVHHGGMLGYVLDGDVKRAMSNVSKNICSNRVSLRMDSRGDWIESSVRRDDSQAKETTHRRVSGTQPFRIHHLFVAGATAPDLPRQRQSAPIRGRLAKSPAKKRKR